MAKDSNNVVGLDIGTTKVCAIVCELDSEGGLEIVGIGHTPSRGLRKGVVVNIDDTVDSVRRAVEDAGGLAIKQASIERIVAEGGRVAGVRDSLGTCYPAGAAIVTTGTFLNGLMHIGFESFEAGRAGEFPSKGLSASLMAAIASVSRRARAPSGRPRGRTP